MDTDDLEPIKKKPVLKDLQVMSVAALEEYIEELNAEIERARAMIKSKKAVRGDAEALFSFKKA